MKEFGADYQCQVVDGVVVIFDMDKGNRSVTNDVRRVLRGVARSVGGLHGKRVIYRDSTKTFDGVLHDGSDFEGFYPIGETVLESAIAKARLRE